MFLVGLIVIVVAFNASAGWLADESLVMLLLP